MSTQKDQNSRKEAHECLHARSYRNLEKARENASRKSGYDSSKTRQDITLLFRERFGTDPYEWQLDVTEAILLGLDSVVIAGTGAGKTMPFMMPLLLDRKKKVLIISPLKVLQADQVCSCKFSLTACTHVVM
jgi:bloom syndrome protein